MKLNGYGKQNRDFRADVARKDMTDNEIANMGQEFRKAKQAVMNLEQYAQTGQSLNDIQSITDKLQDIQRQITKNSER